MRRDRQLRRLRDLFATLALQRLINSLRFEVKKSWSIEGPYTVIPKPVEAIPHIVRLDNRVCRRFQTGFA